ncbi:hypothetical protein B1810_08360, partial [Panacagrimonas perspica]|uniref:thiosulfate oxidation carrier protein SoxY n=1 Tax=Panacagrimonas perspica TaxID=381431 RepID=UPI001138D594
MPRHDAQGVLAHRVAGARCALVALLLIAPSIALAAKLPDSVKTTDPLRSPAWDAMVARHLDGGPVEFDERVQVTVPPTAEDALAVPVEVRVDDTLTGVEELRLIADLNPIPLILSYRPTRADPFISFRFKVEQSTPVRAAARTKDGVWHVGGAWLSAAGGGCTAPSHGTGEGMWRDQLNQVSGGLWGRGGDRRRHNLVGLVPVDRGP